MQNNYLLCSLLQVNQEGRKSFSFAFMSHTLEINCHSVKHKINEPLKMTALFEITKDYLSTAITLSGKKTSCIDRCQKHFPNSEGQTVPAIMREPSNKILLPAATQASDKE